MSSSNVAAQTANRVGSETADGSATIAVSQTTTEIANEATQQQDEDCQETPSLEQHKATAKAVES